MQTSISEFILIYDRQTHQKNLEVLKKRAPPLSPGTREYVRLVPKKETLTHVI
jgi:hypothetical protein